MDTIPIANKWVFTKKYRKTCKLLKYKGRLVAKGCMQQLGYDYLKTFSPVVQMETMWVILSITVAKALKIQQMDIKGAYLNSMLRETVYMCQLGGYKDGTCRVCLLKETLYRMKQSRNK